MKIEGPENYTTTTYLSCINCKYFSKELLVSGKNPKYSFICNHKEIPEQNQSFSKLIGNLSSYHLGIPVTPTWCPFRNK